MAGLVAACPGGGAAPAPGNGGRAGPIELPLAEGELVQKLCLSPDDRYLIAAVEDGERRVNLSKWDLQTKERKQLTWVPKYQMVRSLNWTRGGELVVGTEDWISWFNPETGRPRAELRIPYPRHGGLRYEEWDGDELTKCVHLKGDYRSPTAIVGDQVLLPDLAGYSNKQFRLLEFKKRGADRVVRLPDSARYFQPTSLQVSADGTTVVGSEYAKEQSDNARLWVWSVKMARLIQELNYAPRDSIAGLDHLLAVSRDGSYVVASPGNFARAVYVFDVQKGKQLHQCPTDGSVQVLAASPAADVFACHTSRDRVEVWKMSDGKRLATFEAGRDNDGDLQFSPDGTRLVWGWKVIRVANVPAAK